MSIARSVFRFSDFARGTAVRNAPLHRAIASSSRRPAVVNDEVNEGGDSNGGPNPYLGLTPEQRKIVIEAKRERNFKKYEAMLLERARKEGLSSVEELRARQEERRRAADAAASASADAARPTPMSGLTEQDAKVAAEIRARVEAEAKRKLETGQFGSGPGVKTLADIIDVDKMASDPPSKITELWTGYHTLKNKLSAVIPATTYARMIEKARAYPQFILPLPRTIIGSLDNQEETANVAPGEAKQGYEMQYLEWGFLPPPPPNKATEQAELSADELESIAKAPPSTVLFTPLAEYKLRQEYAQPVLVLTHYTDLAASKGIVLMRGEVTGQEEAQAAPTGVAAAAAAAAAGESKEVQEKLKAPLRSQGKMTQQDAQLLTVTLQRFFMENKEAPIPGAEERQALLDAFHRDQERFDIDKLCTVSFAT